MDRTARRPVERRIRCKLCAGRNNLLRAIVSLELLSPSSHHRVREFLTRTAGLVCWKCGVASGHRWVEVTRAGGRPPEASGGDGAMGSLLERGGEGGPSISHDGTGLGSRGDDGTIEIPANQWGDGGMVAQPRRAWHRFEMRNSGLKKAEFACGSTQTRLQKMAVKTNDSAHMRGTERC